MQQFAYVLRFTVPKTPPTALGGVQLLALHATVE
jgi:hypothetical protein